MIVDTCEITGYQTVCSMACSCEQQNENARPLHYWPLMRGNHRWRVDPHHKRSVMRMRKAFPFYEHILHPQIYAHVSRFVVFCRLVLKNFPTVLLPMKQIRRITVNIFYWTWVQMVYIGALHVHCSTESRVCVFIISYIYIHIYIYIYIGI